MISAIQYIIDSLKAARERKKLTQRALSKKVKIPQSHISKIENGNVDLHLSSLVQLARTLEMEVMLVPRSLVRIVDAMQQNDQSDGREQVPLYQLTERDRND